MFVIKFKVEFNGKTSKVKIKLEKSEFDFLWECNSKFIRRAPNMLTIVDHFFTDVSRVNDETRYFITVNSSGIIKTRITGTHAEGRRNIVLLLESPHTAEYKIINGRLKPIGPAQGTKASEAGGAIETYIEDIISKVELENGKYSLVICNPIQFQTSLGSIYEKGINQELRDLIWTTIWDIEEVREDFLNRLKEINPCKIINACTKELKPFVNLFLRVKGYEAITYSTFHPAVNWNIPERRKVIKER